MEKPYRELVKIYSEANDPAMAIQTLERFIKAFHKTGRPKGL
jgi:hypothetical protein